MSETQVIRNFDPALGCLWCNKPFQAFTRRCVPSPRLHWNYIRRTVKFMGQKYQVRGVVCGACDEKLYNLMYKVDTSTKLFLELEEAEL